MKKTSLNLIKVWNQKIYETTTGMQWYKGKNYISITLRNEKQKHVLHLWCQILYSDIYIHTQCSGMRKQWSYLGRNDIKKFCV